MSFPLDENGIALFRSQFREQFEGDPQRAKFIKMSAKAWLLAALNGIYRYFLNKTATFLDYCPQDAILCLHGDLDASAQAFWAEAQSRYRTLAHDAERPLLPPEKVLIKTEDFFKSCHAFSRFNLTIATNQTGLPALEIERRADKPLHKLHEFLQSFKGKVFMRRKV